MRRDGASGDGARPPLFIMTVTPRKDLVLAMLDSPAFQQFMQDYNVLMTAVLGVVTLTILALLFYNIAKLSTSYDSDFRRREAINGILVCLVCLGIVGGIDTVYAVILAFVYHG